MQFLSTLFGGSENTLLNAAFSLAIVLVLVLLGLWAMKYRLQASTNLSRGRSRRLMVVESIQIDSRRKVTILRRDNVEHVIMTGGAQDVVLETGIALDAAARRAPVRPAPKSEGSEPAGAKPASVEPTPRDPVERKGDLPQPVQSRQNAMLRRSLLRSAARDPLVIPTPGYNSDAAAGDSATTGPVNQTNGQAKLGAASSSRFPSSPPKA